MRSFTPLTLLLSSTLIPSTLSQSSSSSSSCIPCLSDDEVPGIASRWLNAFATDGIAGLSSAVTPDIHIYDSGATNGTLDAYVTDSAQLHDTIALGPYGGNGVTNVTYDVVFTWHSCDRIALRWQQNVLTTDMIGYGSNVGAGRRLSFRGTDLLTVELGSRKVMNVTTSADLLGCYRGLGYDLGVWTVEGQGTGEGATTGPGLS